MSDLREALRPSVANNDTMKCITVEPRICDRPSSANHNRDNGNHKHHHQSRVAHLMRQLCLLQTKEWAGRTLNLAIQVKGVVADLSLAVDW